MFSSEDLAQLQLRADCLPQEQVACLAIRETTCQSNESHNCMEGERTTGTLNVTLAATGGRLGDGHDENGEGLSMFEMSRTVTRLVLSKRD